LRQIKILFIVSEDWYFVSHRLDVAIKAIECGYSVALLSHFSDSRDKINKLGIETLDWSLNRSSKNLFKEWSAVHDILSALDYYKPDLIHSVAMKPVLYSALATRINFNKPRIFALAGLGFIYSSERRIAKILRTMVKVAFKFLFIGNQIRVILQNPDDKSLLLSVKVIDENHIRVIRGAGVNVNLYSLTPIALNLPIIVLPSRMLWAKGIGDFIDCARAVNKNGIKARFVLVGAPDTLNPDTISADQLKAWDHEGIIEWWGHQNDMPNVYQQSTIVCLPTSYGEGLPKSLLEAASCGRPIISYNVPGCREVVIDGLNGILIPLKDIDALIKATETLLNDYELCVQMGKNGRELIVKEFSLEQIANETMAVWEEVLN